MKGFIFAAGFGERLKPISDFLPKPLLPVLNVPVICYSLFLLRECGITDIVCNLHYRHAEIIEFFSRNGNFGMNIHFSIEESILGTGGGLKKCEKEIGDSDFVLINSDVIIDINLADLIAHHRRSSSPATVMLQKTGAVPDFRPVAVRDGRAVDFNNFLSTGLSSEFSFTGVSILSPEIFPYLKEEFSSIVYTGFIELIKKGGVEYVEHRGLWHDIGSVRSLWSANILSMAGVLSLGGRLKGAPGITVEPVSKDAVIREGAEVKNSVIGAESIIGAGARIADSVIMPGTAISPGSLVVRSVAFRDVVISV